jgi:hypothetical protein
MSQVAWQYVGYFAGPLTLILLALLLWSRREKRRVKAIKLSETFREWKLNDMADLCLAYAIGNYIGTDSVTRIIHKIIDRLEAEGAVSVFRGLGWKMADVFIANPDDLAELQRRISVAVAMKTVVATAAGAAVAAVAPVAGLASGALGLATRAITPSLLP